MAEEVHGYECADWSAGEGGEEEGAFRDAAFSVDGLKFVQTEQKK